MIAVWLKGSRLLLLLHVARVTGAGGNESSLSFDDLLCNPSTPLTHLHSMHESLLPLCCSSNLVKRGSEIGPSLHTLHAWQASMHEKRVGSVQLQSSMVCMQLQQQQSSSRKVKPANFCSLG
jgi:hypothetical protein